MKKFGSLLMAAVLSAGCLPAAALRHPKPRYSPKSRLHLKLLHHPRLRMQLKLLRHPKLWLHPKHRRLMPALRLKPPSASAA